MGCPGGMSTIRCTRISINARFSGPFFFNFFLKKDFNGKKDRCAVFGRNNDSLFPEKYLHWRSLFTQKARVNTEGVPHGHPIILLKSSKFKMAAVSVKRSIYYFLHSQLYHFELTFAKTSGIVTSEDRGKKLANREFAVCGYPFAVRRSNIIRFRLEVDERSHSRFIFPFRNRRNINQWK